MASRYEVELKLVSATNLKNVNWRNGPNHPYAIVWVEPGQKYSTKVDKIGDTQPNWGETFVIPLPLSATIEDSMLYIDVLHAHLESETKPIIIGSTKLRLEDVHNDIGIGIYHWTSRTMKLKRPSGRPQGVVNVKVTIRDNNYPRRTAYGVPPFLREFKHFPLPAYVSPYSDSAPPHSSNMSNVYSAPPIYIGPPPTSNFSSVYIAPPIYSAATPASYAYDAPPYWQTSYGYEQTGQQNYGYGQQSYGYGQRLEAQAEENKKGKLGMGAGLAMGGLAGGLGALTLGKGVDMFEDKIADSATEKVEEDFEI